MNKGSTRIVLYLLIVSSIMVFSSVGFFAVLASLTSSPSITIKTSYYGVNNQGVTAIYLQGRLNIGSLNEWKFQLSIPHDFDILSLSNGSSILEVMNEGKPFEKIINVDEFRICFIIKTYNTTVLPQNYSLQIVSPQKTILENITPKWLVGDGGGRAGLTSQGPYITTFWAFNRYKGEQEFAKTWVYNPLSYPTYLYYIKYKTESDTYTDWDGQWTPLYYIGTNYLGPYQTLVVHDYYDCIFSAQSNKKYAFNSGYYHINEVYVKGYDAGGGLWDDSYMPSSSQGDFPDFIVNNYSGLYHVFVAHLVDNNFKDAFPDYQGWFDQIETKDYTYQSSSTNLNDQFGIYMTSLVLDWNPDSTDIRDLYYNVMRPCAKEALGLSNDWYNTRGTHAANHGFDMLFAHRYVLNTNGQRGGMVTNNWNQAIMMKGYWIIYPILGRVIDQTLGTMHETLHTFECHDLDPWYFVMSKYWANYEMHEDTVSEIDLWTYQGA